MSLGTTEILLILLVAAIVLGPERAKLYARKFGKGIRTLRLYMDSVTDDLKETVIDPLQELQQPLKEATQPLNDIKQDLNQSFNGTVRRVKDTSARSPKHEREEEPLEAVALAEDE